MPRTGGNDAPLTTSTFSTSISSSLDDSFETRVSTFQFDNFSTGIAPGEMEMIASLEGFGRRSLRISKACYLATILAALCCVLFIIDVSHMWTKNESSSNTPSHAQAFCTAGGSIPYSDRTETSSRGICGHFRSEAEEGDFCDYNCVPNYERTNTHRCNANGTWTGGGCSLAGCLPRIAQPESHIQTTCNHIAAYGDTCTAICKRGFTSSPLGHPSAYSIIHNYTCSHDGSWSTETALSWPGFVCRDIDECSQNNGGCGPGVPCTNHFGAPHSCGTFGQCQTGYVRDPATGNCTVNEVVQCQGPTSIVANSDRAQIQNQCVGEYRRATRVGDICQFSCDVGFSGSGNLTCSRRGVWSGGSCTPTQCTAGGLIANSNRRGRNRCRGSTGSVCNYTCSDGFFPGGQEICSADGSFQGGSCTQASCTGPPTLPIPGGIFADTTSNCAGSPTGFVCRLNCTIGYTLHGSGTVICSLQDDSMQAQWVNFVGASTCDDVDECTTANSVCVSPEAPYCHNSVGSYSCSQCAAGTTLNSTTNECVAQSCDAQFTVAHSAFMHSEETHHCIANFNEECAFSCLPGYTASRSAICQADGTISQGVCMPIACEHGAIITHSNRDDLQHECTGTVGDVCQYVCDDGFEHGSEHTCAASGRWIGGSCSPMQGCNRSVESQFDNVRVQYDIQQPNVATMECVGDSFEISDEFVDFVSTDDVLYLQCEDSQWQIVNSLTIMSLSAACRECICQPITCLPQTVENGVWGITSAGVNGQAVCGDTNCATVGASASVVCNDGFLPLGTTEVFCSPSGDWVGGSNWNSNSSRITQSCVPMQSECPTVVVENARVEIDQGGAYAIVRCTDGSTLSQGNSAASSPASGPESIDCSLPTCMILQCVFGEWQPSIPHCHNFGR